MSPDDIALALGRDDPFIVMHPSLSGFLNSGGLEGNRAERRRKLAQFRRAQRREVQP